MQELTDIDPSTSRLRQTTYNKFQRVNHLNQDSDESITEPREDLAAQPLDELNIEDLNYLGEISPALDF